VLASVVTAWSELQRRSESLPAAPPGHPSALALTRSSGLMVFIFGDAPWPLVVTKPAGRDDAGLRAERAALRAAAPAGAAPRDLGDAGAVWVQEGLRGDPIRVRPLDERLAGKLPWPPELESAVRGLAVLASATREAGPREDLRDFRSLGSDIEPSGGIRLPGRVRRAVAAASRDLERLEVAILRHGDPSPQNVHVDGGRLVGFFDWETAVTGTPGVDALILALSWIEMGVGLRDWSVDRAAEAFRAAREGPFGRGARAAVAAAVAAADVDERYVEPIEVAFFAQRLAVRLMRPGAQLTPAGLAARELEMVCAG
jgi:hypothetical protein